jgi:hypothetical protein
MTVIINRLPQREELLAMTVIINRLPQREKHLAITIFYEDCHSCEGRNL